MITIALTQFTTGFTVNVNTEAILFFTSHDGSPYTRVTISHGNEILVEETPAAIKALLNPEPV